MANDTEIEIKIPLDKATFSQVKEKLKKIAKFVKTSNHLDEYFTPSHRNFVEPKFPFEWLRIGKRGNKVILNYKHYYPENVKVATHCDELEIEIQNAKQLRKLFSALDFKELVTVDKERDIYVFNNEFEIALDAVKDLGYFIEIEAIKNFGNIDETRKKLFEFAKTLGIDTSNPDLRGYPFLMMQKKGLI